MFTFYGNMNAFFHLPKIFFVQRCKIATFLYDFEGSSNFHTSDLRSPKIFIESYGNKTKYIFKNKLEFINFIKKFNRRFIIIQLSIQHGTVNFVM